MKLLNWMEYRKIINVIILIKLLKVHYTSFYIAIHVFQTIIIYTAIHVSKQFQCVL